jgi:hypothetical protein
MNTNWPGSGVSLVRSGTMVCTRCVCCPCLVCSRDRFEFDVVPQRSMRPDFPSSLGSRAGTADTDYMIHLHVQFWVRARRPGLIWWRGLRYGHMRAAPAPQPRQLRPNPHRCPREQPPRQDYRSRRRNPTIVDELHDTFGKRDYLVNLQQTRLLGVVPKRPARLTCIHALIARVDRPNRVHYAVIPNGQGGVPTNVGAPQHHAQHHERHARRSRTSTPTPTPSRPTPTPMWDSRAQDHFITSRPIPPC